MKKLFMMVLIMGLSLSASAAIVDYQFNDDAGTDWQSLAQTGTDASQWNFNTAEAKADGTGDIHATGVSKDWTRKNILSSAVTSGIIALEFRISDWDLTGGTDTNGLGFGMSAAMKMRIDAKNGTDLRIFSAGAEHKQKVIAGAAVATEGLIMRAEVNLDTDTYDTMYKFDSDAVWTALSTGAAFTVDYTEITATIEGTTAWTAGTYIDVDYVTVSEIPEPATMAILGLGGLLIRRRK